LDFVHKAALGLYHLMISDTLRLFNSHSRDPADHFKLVVSPDAAGRHEIRLCNSHPRFITCTLDGVWINVRGTGPESLHLRFNGCNPQSLHSLLDVLHLHRDSGDDLLDWELEDWVGSGNPCRLRGTTKDLSKESLVDLGLTVADLWCVDLFPNIEARLV
jgi:hypothetical protein